MASLTKVPDHVRAFAVKLGFDCSMLLGNEVSGWFTISPSRTAAVIEVYFNRTTEEDPWKWHGAIHRVHWSDPIAKNLGGAQPELSTLKAFKAYAALLAAMLNSPVSAGLERKNRSS